ncbi:MAG: hypothetical protein WBX15_03500, partial [Thermoanaerobaculia bacterium]
RLSVEAERLREFLAQSETSLSDLVQRSENSRGQVSTLEAEAVEQQALLDEKSRALESATAERNRLREASDETEQARQQRANQVRDLERTLATSRESLMRTIARISESRNQVHQIEIAVEKCEFYLGKLDDTARKVSEGRQEAAARMEEADRMLREAESAMVHAQHALRDALDRRNALTSRRDEVLDSLKSARDSISQTTYKIDSLRTLLQSLESQDEEVRRAVLDLAPTASSAAEAVHAAPGYEIALDALLRDISRAVVIDDSATAVEAIRRLHERGAGRGAFIALDYRADAVALSEGGAEHVILGDGPVADAVRAAVPEAYVVDDLARALEEARRRPHATFVTRDGDMVRGPLVYGGKKAGGTGIFSIKREVADLEALLSSEQERASGIAGDLERLEEELRTADDTRILSEERQRQSEQNLREQAKARELVIAELERFDKDLAVASEERSLYHEEKVQLLERKSQAQQELRELESAEQSTQEKIRETEELLKNARIEFEEITEVSSRARVDLESAVGRVNSIQREHENYSRIVLSLANRTRELKSEIESLERRRSETEEASESARTNLEKTLVTLRDLGEQRIALEAQVAELDERVRALDESATASREEWNRRRGALFEAERRLDRSRSAFDLLREQILLDLHAGIEALGEVEPPADDETREQLESESTRLAEQIEKIGPVNVLAIDEYHELEEREKFLRTQRDDLVQSIESLRSTIRKINITSRELFRDAFTAVNESFGQIFVSLFGGGKAAMQLLDEDDILESGIELIAQPPGKKTNSIALLSGGERALTALALLFAIFRYKPSPFCLLDEVDAPLDEVNNERFVRLVREMSRDTQFIVITHSKRTMEAADILYGVTMEEAGCSRLVSVSFADMEA